MTAPILVSPVGRSQRRGAARPAPAPTPRPTERVRATSAARASWWQRVLRERIHARLRQLQSGALEIHDFAGTARFGDAAGPLGCTRIWIRDPAFYSALATSGAIGAGEAFVGGAWETDDLVTVLRLLVRDREVLLDVDRSLWSTPRQWLLRLGHALRRNSQSGSKRNIAAHYDLSDELFELFLDPTMTYSSAWFESPNQSLEDAQRHKLRRLCRLVDLAPGERLLEIGTGWGSLAITAAAEFDAHVTTTTISSNQFETARRRVAAAGLTDRVAALQRDYRELGGTFDKLISCEMIEAVGAQYLPEYLKTCDARLRRGGVLGLQAITIRDQHYESALRHVDYIKRHVFPGSFIPSVSAITAAATRHTDLRLTRLEDFGLHYADTLQRWRETWQTKRDEVATLAGGRDAGDELLRAWSFYFAYCEAGFRERHISVCHLRFEK